MCHRPSNARRHSFHLETAAKLLNLLEGILILFSKRALKSLNNQTDFDSAIRRFDPSAPAKTNMQARQSRGAAAAKADASSNDNSFGLPSNCTSTPMGQLRHCATGGRNTRR